MSRIYVAGKWQDRKRVQEIQERLRRRGHTITIDWTCHEFDAKDGVVAGFDELALFALEDEWGVRSADAVIAVMEQDYSYKGAWVEIGMALALGKPVYMLGTAGHSCIFVNHPSIQPFQTMEQIEEVLR